LRFLGRYSWEKAHRDGEELARAHLALLRMLDYKMDLLKVTPFYRYMSLIWGSRYRFVDNEEEVEGIDVVVKGPEDWGRLWVLDPRRELREHLWAVELLSRELGASTPFIYTIPSPLVQALHHVSTPERVYADMAEHPDALREGLRVIAESCIEFGRACLEEGATGIFYGVGSGGRYWSRMTREQLEEYALRYDRMVLKALRDAPIRLLHICSTRDEDPQKFGGLMEEGWFRHYPVDALNWWDAQFTPLEVAKGVYGDRFCLVGGLDQEGALKAGDPGEVEEGHRGRRRGRGLHPRSWMHPPSGDAAELLQRRGEGC